MNLGDRDTPVDEAAMGDAAASYLRERPALDIGQAGAALGECVAALDRCFASGATVYVAGNGGSATTASHLTIDVSRAAKSTGRYESVRVVSLPDAGAAVTAIANDEDYAEVFASQLRGTIVRHDVLLSISVSGESENLVRAAKVAAEVGATTLAFVGDSRSTLAAIVDTYVAAPVNSYGHVEDLHLSYNHAIVCALAGSDYMRVTR